MFCLPFWYFPHISSPFPYIPFHYYLYSPNEWDHIMFVLLRLTYFTQHNTPQFHPRWSKWWVFIVSNGWGIFRCIQRPHLLYPSSVDGHRGSFHSLLLWTSIPNSPPSENIFSVWEYPPFASTWMELEGIMLSEVSQSEKDKHYMFSFIWGI